MTGIDASQLAQLNALVELSMTQCDIDREVQVAKEVGNWQTCAFQHFRHPVDLLRRLDPRMIHKDEVVQPPSCFCRLMRQLKVVRQRTVRLKQPRKIRLVHFALAPLFRHFLMTTIMVSKNYLSFRPTRGDSRRTKPHQSVPQRSSHLHVVLRLR